MRMRGKGIQIPETILIAALFVIISQVATAQAQTPSNACTGPTDKVMVMVLQDPHNQQAYLFVIKNNSNDRIPAFTVGDGSKPQLHIANFAVPSQITGPTGWTATHAFKEESMFMHWAWTAKSPDAMIAPGELASGFKITLPPFPASAQNKLYADETPMRPIKMSQLPFRIQFASGECVWGQIRPLIIGSSGN